MAGHYGHERVTTQNLKVVAADDEKGLLLVSGAVPGPSGGYIIVKDAVQARPPQGCAVPGRPAQGCRRGGRCRSAAADAADAAPQA